MRAVHEETRSSSLTQEALISALAIMLISALSVRLRLSSGNFSRKSSFVQYTGLQVKQAKNYFNLVLQTSPTF